MSSERAVEDIRYLLDRGYPQKGAVSFVCNHYRLDDKAMHLLSRTVIPAEISEKRRAKFLQCDKMSGTAVVIDGYNILIGMESILEGRAYLCDDGAIRDVKGIFRSYRTSEITNEAVEVILRFLKEKAPAYVCFLFDSQISKSGLLARSMREKIKEAGIKGDARTSRHVDYDLKSSKYIVATSDGVIIDEAPKVVNFLACVIKRFGHLEERVAREIAEAQDINLRDEQHE